jgi:RNA polymerase sigma-70 factor (ECF subfamily)
VTVDAADPFVAARPRLLGIAYRLLGSRAEAEDVVGDVAERWARADQAVIAAPEGWLVTVTTRRALDVLRAARLRRVDYPGEWLPEPVATDGDPTIDVERRETLTMGFLVLLERLTPIERAVLVLHDVLELPYDAVADAVGRGEDACRQALHRARRHVAVPRPRPPAEREQAAEVARRFMAVDLGGGDLSSLLASLAPEIAVISDGGGVVHAAMRPVTGATRCARYLLNLASRVGDDPLFVPCELNGEPGLLLHALDGWAALTVTVDRGLVTTICVVANPAKLEHLVGTLVPDGAGRPGPWEARGLFRHRRGQRVQ